MLVDADARVRHVKKNWNKHSGKVSLKSPASWQMNLLNGYRNEARADLVRFGFEELAE